MILEPSLTTLTILGNPGWVSSYSMGEELIITFRHTLHILRVLLAVDFTFRWPEFYLCQISGSSLKGGPISARKERWRRKGGKEWFANPSFPLLPLEFTEIWSQRRVKIFRTSLRKQALLHFFYKVILLYLRESFLGK